jgi:hypothetical protein
MSVRSRRRRTYRQQDQLAIYSLRAPGNLAPPDAAEVARGRTLFTEHACIDCHQGPRGSGVRLFDYSELGTDEEMKKWMDPFAGVAAMSGNRARDGHRAGVRRCGTHVRIALADDEKRALVAFLRSL